MLAGLRKLRAILATEPMASRVVREILPGPACTTDEQLIDYMRREGHCEYFASSLALLARTPARKERP